MPSIRPPGMLNLTPPPTANQSPAPSTPPQPARIAAIALPIIDAASSQRRYLRITRGAATQGTATDRTDTTDAAETKIDSITGVKRRASPVSSDMQGSKRQPFPHAPGLRGGSAAQMLRIPPISLKALESAPDDLQLSLLRLIISVDSDDASDRWAETPSPPPVPRALGGLSDHFFAHVPTSVEEKPNST